MQLRSFALAGALVGASMIAATPVAPAVTPALLLPPAMPAPSPASQAPRGPRIYKLPFAGGTSREVCQGNNHAGSTHTGVAAYAWDFCMPVGSPVTAARGGIVSAVRQDSQVGGWDPKFIDDANYVVVDHGDGTSAVYMHLMFDGARVKVGERVQTGQLLAYSGQTGYASAPHLHFMVMQTVARDYYAQSLPVLFEDVAANGGLPVEGSSYTSGNAGIDPRLATPTGPPPFVPFWVETYKASTLWSGADGKAVRFGPAGPWQFFEVTTPQTGPRLQVTVAATGLPAYIPAGDVGPSGSPPSTSSGAGSTGAASGAGQAGVTSGNGPVDGASSGGTAGAASGSGAAGVASGNGTAGAASGNGTAGAASGNSRTTDTGQVRAASAGQAAAGSGAGQAGTANGNGTAGAASRNGTAGLATGADQAAAGNGQVTVVAGDTLFSIAKAHQVSLEQLLAANHLADPNHVPIGQTIVLAGLPLGAPAPVAVAAQQQVTVAPGDTLFSIAAANHLAVDKLASFNGIGDPNELSVGQVLKLS